MLKRVIITFVLVCIVFVHVQAQRSGSIELYFKNDNYSIFRANAKALDSLTEILKSGTGCHIKVEGYTDRNGSIKANDILAAKRAQQVAIYFAERGMPKDSVCYESWGMRRMKYNPEMDSLNRRVEISYIVYDKKATSGKKEAPVKKSQDIEIKKTETYLFEEMKKISTANVGDKIILPIVQFYPGTPSLMPSAFPVLDTLVLILEQNPEMEISIEGHICCFNHDEDNLSGQRARTVYNYLVEKSISKERLEYKGFGHRYPLTQERTSEEMQMNRRVEVRIRKK